MRGRRRKVGAMSELRPDAQADGERRVGMVEPACDVEAQRPYRRFPAHADAHAGMPVRFGAVEGAAAVAAHREIGRASCRARVCQYEYISVVAVTLKNQHT